MDNGRLLFGLLDLLYCDYQGWMQICMRPISATITEMEGPVDTIEEEEGVIYPFND